jgi:hypothetical protein
MPKVTNNDKTKRRKKRSNRSKRKRTSFITKISGGTSFPPVYNVIEYNRGIGLKGDPIDPSTQISGRNWVGGKKRKLSKKFMRSLKKKKGGSIFNYDLLTGNTYQDNAVRSINSSSGTQNTLGKIIGNPQETGPILSYQKLPSDALI